MSVGRGLARRNNRALLRFKSLRIWLWFCKRHCFSFRFPSEYRLSRLRRVSIFRRGESTCLIVGFSDKWLPPFSQVGVTGQCAHWVKLELNSADIGPVNGQCSRRFSFRTAKQKESGFGHSSRARSRGLRRMIRHQHTRPVGYEFRDVVPRPVCRKCAGNRNGDSNKKRSDDPQTRCRSLTLHRNSKSTPLISTRS